jgi:hypothetical protein
MEAEKMHLKAIQIKESLLGKEDYEVDPFLIFCGVVDQIRRDHELWPDPEYCSKSRSEMSK